MKKTVINRQVKINAPKEKVWAALADFGNVQVMSPNIAKSYSTSDAPNGVGATRHCDFTAMGATVEEKIVEWNEGDSMRIHLYDTKNMPMIRDIQAHFGLTESEGTTSLTATFEYGMSNAIGGFMNNLAMKKINIKSWETFMAGIRHHVETGENVDKSTDLNMSEILTLN